MPAVLPGEVLGPALFSMQHGLLEAGDLVRGDGELGRDNAAAGHGERAGAII